jgi:drug/metabolite transporter (DMT)-like permease
VLFFVGLKYITASESVVLTSMQPLFIVIFGVLLLGERFTLQMLVGGVLLCMGIGIYLWPDIQTFTLSFGVYLVLGSSIFGALTTIAHKKYIFHRHLDSVILVRVLLSLIVVGVWMLLWEPQSVQLLVHPVNVWLILAVPVLTFLLPFFLFYRSLRRVKAVDAGIIEVAGLVFALVAASVILKEQLTTMNLVAVSFVLFGVLFVNVPISKWRIVPSRLREAGPLRK